MALINCNECDKQVSDKALSCPNCGAPVSGQAAVMPATAVTILRDNRSMAIMLAIFGGFIGLHKFYLHQPGWGIVYLILCFTLIPAFIGFFEGLSSTSRISI